MQRKIIEFALMWLETVAVVGFVMFPVLGLLIGWASGGFLSGLLSMLVAAVCSVVVFGGVFLMLENNQTLKNIRTLLQARTGL